MGDIPNGIPPLRAMRAPPGRIAAFSPRPVNLGKEVSYENLVPGETYYFRSMNGPYDEIQLVGREGQMFQYRRLQPLRNGRNGPVREPHAPVAPGAPRMNQRVGTEMWWPHHTFYKINNVKRKGRFINHVISRKLKRQALSNVLAKGKLPTLPGTGPGNTIRKFAGWSKKNFQGGRKTRKQRGGSNNNSEILHTARVQKNILDASRKTVENPTGQYYFVVSEDSLAKGNAMVIGPRYEYGSAVKGNDLVAKAKEAKREQSAAKFPYEECLFFFEIKLPRSYPFEPPKFNFLNARITNYRLHPNLYGHGYHTVGTGTDEKVCLEILNTYGDHTWNPKITIWAILNELTSGLLVENPGIAEPSWTSLHDENTAGILYNRHVLYEAIDVTSKVYDMVVKAIPPDATPETLEFSASNISRGRVPAFVVPFLSYLAKRAYFALNFLIGKLETFIEASGGKRSLALPEGTFHHPAKTANYGALIDRMKATLALIPPALRVSVVKANIKEVYRTLWEVSKPKITLPNGTEVIMPYEQFAEEMEQLARNTKRKETEAAARAATAAAGSGNNEENTTEYVYENNNYQPNNGNE